MTTRSQTMNAVIGIATIVLVLPVVLVAMWSAHAPEEAKGEEEHEHHHAGLTGGQARIAAANWARVNAPGAN